MTSRDHYPTLAKLAERNPDTTAGQELAHLLNECDQLRNEICDLLNQMLEDRP